MFYTFLAFFQLTYAHLQFHFRKDYLHEGAMADSADLVVLGAWYGSGQKGGIMSIFLMGCMDKSSECRNWKTVK